MTRTKSGHPATKFRCEPCLEIKCMDDCLCECHTRPKQRIVLLATADPVEALIARVPHDRDLSSATVVHMPGSVVFVNSANFPCKTDCVRCGLESALRASRTHITAEQVAELFHTRYEELAPSFGYSTRKESAVPWKELPENNRKLMIAVSEFVLAASRTAGGGVEGLREALITHEPLAYRDHSDAWINCTCGWGSFGESGEDWANHFLAALAASASPAKQEKE
jgi:hypothetical protein